MAEARKVCPVCDAGLGPCRTRRGHPRHDHRARRTSHTYTLRALMAFEEDRTDG